MFDRNFNIDVAINDENGNATTRCTRMYISDPNGDQLMEIECDVNFKILNQFSVRIGRRKFSVSNRESYVGSIIYDSFNLTGWSAALIINYLRELGSNCTEAIVPLFSMFDAGQRIEYADLKHAIEQSQ